MKKKVFVGIIIILFILIFLSTIWLIFWAKREGKISLTQDNVIIEYGNIYNPNIEELIDLSKYSFINLEKIRIENNIENEENKNYPAVGVYEINVYYKDKVFKQNIEVKDTIAPDLTIQDNIEIEYNTNISTIDFKKYITISDLSETKSHKVDVSKINSSVSGEYEAVLSIEDIYGNKTQKNFKIKVLEKPEEKVVTKVEPNKKTTVNTNNNTSQSTTSQKVDSNVEKTQITTNSNIASKEDTIVDNTKKEDEKEIQKCIHEKSFDTQDEVKEYYNNTLRKYKEKLESGEIKTYEEYVKACPYRI